jgi:drug/metabolite transporter (DMT)-like permease
MRSSSPGRFLFRTRWCRAGLAVGDVLRIVGTSRPGRAAAAIQPPSRRLAATGAGQLAIVAVVTALYPAVTILPARLTLQERWSWLQIIGLGRPVDRGIEFVDQADRTRKAIFR